ncbi:hypothetical protein Y032_0040g309 [Ancylostoma ceylanicum]|uniref:Uncharacterized protein n=2 Tax=Ancylostoma ceylanicum TaxID=53326 RepID=A0A016UHI8_9BILA|nr:hypothetical protein Y032_0040g309 [Ancylostoma ceylanicum]
MFGHELLSLPSNALLFVFFRFADECNPSAATFLKHMKTQRKKGISGSRTLFLPQPNNRMQLGTALTLVTLSGVFAYQQPNLRWPYAKKPWSKVTNRNTKTVVKPGPLDWCSYWNSLGIHKPECLRNQKRPTPVVPLIRDILTTRFSSFTPTCRSRFLLSTCTSSSRCGTGKLCIDTNHITCCLPAQDECPTAPQLGFQCVVRSPVSWCTHNDDCGGRKCCPTGSVLAFIAKAICCRGKLDNQADAQPADVIKRSLSLLSASMSASFDFTGKKALVTGASRGIGYAIAAALSKAGAHVVALARNQQGLEYLRKNHSNITALVCDVTSPEATLSALLAPHQPFDILVNNAGIGLLESCTGLTEEAEAKQLDVNLKAPIILTKIVTSEMIRNSVRGSVVNVSSQASMRPLEHHTAYCEFDN